MSHAADLGHRTWWRVFSSELLQLLLTGFFPFSPPPSLSSPRQVSAKCKGSIMWHSYNTAMPVPNPRHFLYQDHGTREGNEAPEIGENCACLGNSPQGKSNCFQLLLGNPSVQRSINTYQIQSSLPAVFVQYSFTWCIHKKVGTSEEMELDIGLRDTAQ